VGSAGARVAGRIARGATVLGAQKVGALDAEKSRVGRPIGPR